MEITEAIDLLPGILCNVISKINDGNYNAGDTEAPTAPTNLIASNITQNSLTLTWTASTDNMLLLLMRFIRVLLF
jgi:hypothetical protein